MKNKTCILSLSEFVHFQEVGKLSICYQVTLEHPEVIVGAPLPQMKDPESVSKNDNINHKMSNQQQTDLATFTVLPKKMVKAINIKSDYELKDAQDTLFSHVVQFYNQSNFYQKLKVSEYFQVNVAAE